MIQLENRIQMVIRDNLGVAPEEDKREKNILDGLVIYIGGQ